MHSRYENYTSSVRWIKYTGGHSISNADIRTRDTIVSTNTKLGSMTTPPDDDTPFRDQGFTRPKVLILLPTRNACLKVVNSLIGLSGTTQQENKARFEKDYSLDEPDSIPASKPADFRDKFEGNDDDLFRIGIKFTRKSMKLFVEFYNADMILASMDCESTCQGRTALCRSDTWSQILSKASAATRPTRCGRCPGTGLGRQAAPHPSTSTCKKEIQRKGRLRLSFVNRVVSH